MVRKKKNFRYDVARLQQHVSYVPSVVNTDNYCYCGMQKNSNEADCRFCRDPLRLSITKSCQNGKIDNTICQFLSTLG